MPLYWENIEESYSGVDLTAVITNQSVVIWRPELTFPDASSIDVLSSV
jgi:hypothetical protein